MKKILICTALLFFLLTSGSFCQKGKYWVFLKDKKNVSFDPYSYFDQKTIAKRIANNIPLIDSTDFPLNENYLDAVTARVDSVSHCSRWFNAMAVYATPEEIEDVKSFAFVSSVEPMLMECYVSEIKNSDWDTTMDTEQMEVLEKQIKTMGGDLFEKAGIDGKGIRIAIFDGGFPTVDTSPVFEHIRKDGRIIKTWDFVRNKESVYAYVSHGTSVMSCIAGIVNGKKIGLATGAEFLLARTEVRSEPFSEEENWLAAVEWADKNGADIINSSLGYTYHRYFPDQMDGKKSLVARAGN
ncbi:MAG: S8 family serine peptidase, partial [Bacteroidota bacterium]